MATDLIIGGIQTTRYPGASRYVATHQTPGTGIAGHSSFAATTPMLMIYGSTKTVVIDRIALMQSGTIGTNSPTVTPAIDSANRFSSGGTAFGVVNANGGSSDAFGGTCKTGATATAAGAGTRYVGNYLPLKLVSGLLLIDYPDGLVVPPGGSFLLYSFAAGAASTNWQITIDLLELSN